LIATAKLLAAADPATDGHIRRGISTAYYALFHHVLRAGADRFLRDGRTDSAAFSLLYRGFSHGRMKSVCEGLKATTISRSFAGQFRRTTASPDMRAFAKFFLTVQEGRQRADYDPVVEFTASDASAFILDAEAGMAAFDRVDAEEREDVLALMLMNPRA
jgi:uncharacterized protein (UPF0332 family)